MAGGAGDDHLTLLVQGQPDPFSMINLQVDGGAGFDKATDATIVSAINCEQ